MTERLYYTCDDTEGRANVLSCTLEPDGRYAVVLDSTLFHPQGGGQPADVGWIDDEPVETVQSRGDEVLHIVVFPVDPYQQKLHYDDTHSHKFFQFLYRIEQYHCQFPVR